MIRIPYPVAAAVRITFFGYFGMLLILALLQRRLIYHPSRASEERLTTRADRQQLVPWRLENGEYTGWLSSEPAVKTSTNILLVFHGNAGNALDRIYFTYGFHSLKDNQAWDVYLFEYPGFGMRPGKPNERAIKNAATQALDELLENGNQIFLLGESLGCGVAAYLASIYPENIAGVTLVTPFTSLADVAKHHYPLLPVRLLLQERYDNVTALNLYKGPVAFLLAKHDEVVPTELGLELHETYAGPKKLWIQPGSHNSLDYNPTALWWTELAQFLREPKQ